MVGNFHPNLEKRPLRLLKFDAVYPQEYLLEKQRTHQAAIKEMDYGEYYRWFMDQRFYLSDYITAPMERFGWEAREFISHDDILIHKLWENGQIRDFGIRSKIGYIARAIKDYPDRVVFEKIWKNKKYYFYEKYINTFQPDVIFIREPCGVDGLFFERYARDKLIVSMIGCNTAHAKNWKTHRNDLIITITDEYKQFFELQGVPVFHFEYGINDKVTHQAGGQSKKYDCVFVGLLGTPEQSRKTELMNMVAEKRGLKWWGPRASRTDSFPALAKSYQGEVAGLDMLKIYKSARIVLNDYVDTARGFNVNMRTKEVLSVGSFLLTRHAPNIEGLRSSGAIETFQDNQDCLFKIDHFLQNENKREKIAKAGYVYAQENFNYDQIVPKLMSEISRCYHEKFKSSGRS